MREINEETIIDLHKWRVARIKNATKNREIADRTRRLVETVLEIPNVIEGG